ncbi:hypothetical protein [Burkholderia sp. IT-111MI5]|nr:hypothetical protein [Burkholderia cepacia]
MALPAGTDFFDPDKATELILLPWWLTFTAWSMPRGLARRSPSMLH